MSSRTAFQSRAEPEAIDDTLATAGLRKNGRTQRPKARGRADAVRGRQTTDVGADLDVVRIAAFSEIEWLMHGFSTRPGGGSMAYGSKTGVGELNLGLTASDPESTVMANRGLFAAEIAGRSDMPMVTLRQIHSSLVVRAGKADAGERAVLKGDGMMTAERGILLAIQTADCIPVLVADRRKRAVAGFHAGWRGTVKRIVENGIGRMRMEFGSRPEDLVAAIGPGISSCCYAVGEEVRAEFESQFSYAAGLFSEVCQSNPVREKYPIVFLSARAPGHSALGPALHLDLIEANRRQLLAAGLGAEAISIVGECTCCRNDRYFSYRAEHGSTGRMFSVVGIRE